MTVNTMPNWLTGSRSLATSLTLRAMGWKETTDSTGGWHLHRCRGWPGKSKAIHIQWPSRLSMSLGCHSHRQVGPRIHLVPPSFSSAWQRVTKVSPSSPTQAPCWNSPNARVGYKGLGLHRAGLYTHTTFPINQVRAEKHCFIFNSTQILKAMRCKTRHLCLTAQRVTYHFFTNHCHILHTRASYLWLYIQIIKISGPVASTNHPKAQVIVDVSLLTYSPVYFMYIWRI